jgi:nitroreductase
MFVLKWSRLECYFYLRSELFNCGENMINPILKIIRDRRSSVRFKSTPITDGKLNAVLDAGRWAPSWTNTQPWRFIVVKDMEIKERMSSAVSTFFNWSIKDAPICIVTCVNPKEDPFHFIEDGTTATQNMALAAQSMGLGTSWIGVFSMSNEKDSTERKLKEILKIPKEWRLISILPIGVPKFNETKSRKELSEQVDFDNFRTREEQKSKTETNRKPSTEIQKTHEPLSAREIEPALV